MVKDIITSVSESQGIQEVKVYPNPVIDFLRIDNLEAMEESDIEVISISGVRAQQTEIDNGIINVYDLYPGTYFLRLRNRNSVFVTAFVKCR